MANTIALRKAYATMLDEVYKLASLTAVLDGPNELVKEGANANEILIPKMTMSGLANYNKQTGYVAGDVTLEYETKKCTYDRGRMFTVDAMDNIESAGVAFGRLSGEFLRTQVVPELDAWRLSSYADMHHLQIRLRKRLQMRKLGLQRLEKAKPLLKMRKQSRKLVICTFPHSLKGTSRILTLQHLRRCLMVGQVLSRCQKDVFMTK